MFRTLAASGSGTLVSLARIVLNHADMAAAFLPNKQVTDSFPSITAGIVAFARGVASAYPLLNQPLDDTAARVLLPAPVSWLIPRAGVRAARLGQGILRVALAGLVDQIALRTAALDAALHDTLRAGVCQVVLLGAGLDARAYRLASLRAATVYEVDRAATQAFKRRRLFGLTVTAREIVHVPVDLTSGALTEALAAAGHDEKRPTFWLWEGVTMYLPAAAVRDTVLAMASRSCPGSLLAVTYMQPDAVPLPLPLRRLIDVALGVFGEPLRGAFTSGEMASLLALAGYRVLSDEGSRDWAQRFAGSSAMPALFRSERLALAEKS